MSATHAGASPWRRVAACTVLLAALVTGQAPGDWLLVEELATLVNPAPTGGAEFGQAVRLDGDTLVAGAPNAVVGAPSWPRGAACVFRGGGTSWALEDTLTSGESAIDGHFGSSVAISGDTIVVGHPWNSSHRGAAFVFVRSGTTWTQQAKLTAPDKQVDDEFGFAVALDGDTALVGAWHDGEPGMGQSGSAYVFVRSGTTWALQQKLLASDAAMSDLFGSALALDGDTALVGAPYNLLPNGRYGAAYAFVRSGSGWSEQAVLYPAWEVNARFLGSSVALDGDTALAGAPDGAAPGVSAAGNACVFTRAGGAWTHAATLHAADAAQGDGFGGAVALRGALALVGAPTTLAPDHVGAAYAFQRLGATWLQRGKLVDAEPQAYEEYGSSLALDGETAVLGVPGDRISGSACGSARVLRAAIVAWTDLGSGLAGAGGVPLLAGSGPLEPGSAGVLALAGAMPSAPALLFVGLDEAPTPFKGGLLVPVPALLTLPVFTLPYGDTTLAWDAWPSGLPPGTALCFQYAVQDAGAPKGVALSNALRGDVP